MTRYSDNIYSGFQAAVSADSSKAAVLLCKSHFVSAGTGINAIVSGTFPPGTQNINASILTVQNAGTANDNVILYINGNAATGQRVLSFTGIGSAANVRSTPTSYVASAAAFPQPPAVNATNGGEIPYQVIVSSLSTAAYQIHITFNRADTNTLGTTQ